MKIAPYDVLAIGAPLIDSIINVEDSFLNQIPGKKGGMELIQEDLLKSLLAKVNIPYKHSIGGSAANVAKSLAKLGTSTAFIGKTGDDLLARAFDKGLEAAKVVSLCSKGQAPTGQALCFVTPDSNRTCRTFVGASNELQASELKSQYFRQAKLVHLEGYRLLIPNLVEKALERAKQAKALATLDLGSFEVAAVAKERLKTFDLDLIFANEREAYFLTQKKPKESANFLLSIAKVAIITEGSKGCFVASRSEKPFHIPAFPVCAIDTTGAGDLFTAGFIHAYLKNEPLRECAELGARLASEVVQIYGTNLPDDVWINLANRH